MTENEKTQSDAKLINTLFGIDPLDWARRPDGTLVFLDQQGRKSTYTQEQIELLTPKAAQAARATTKENKTIAGSPRPVEPAGVVSPPSLGADAPGLPAEDHTPPLSGGE